jgi:phosphatidylserine/phosphatidylglycerophosphate/cardiolipin synthase-like enzyme
MSRSFPVNSGQGIEFAEHAFQQDYRWIIVVVLLFIVPRNRKPSSATAWLLVISVLPLVGFIIFFLIGSPKLSKRRRAMQCSMSDTIIKAVAEVQSRDEFDSLLDHLGSRKYPGFNTMRKWFTHVGIEYHLSLPLHFFGSRYTRFDLRNHRKLVVIDGQVGFIGSQNMIKRTYFRKDSISYDELVAKVTGPIAAQLDAAFRMDWYSETGVLLDNDTAPETALRLVAAGDILCQVLPSGSGFENENNLKLFTSLLYAAQKTVVICNPYFVPDDSLMTAITSAVQRGVDVKLVNSQVSDQFLVSRAE